MKVLLVLLVFVFSLGAFANDALWKAAKDNDRAEVERILEADHGLGLDYIPVRRVRDVRWHLRRFGHHDIVARIDARQSDAVGNRKGKREREGPEEDPRLLAAGVMINLSFLSHP